MYNTFFKYLQRSKCFSWEFENFVSKIDNQDGEHVYVHMRLSGRISVYVHVCVCKRVSVCVCFGLRASPLDLKIR